MPVETFVTMPTSRGISCGVKASRLTQASERAIEIVLEVRRFHLH